MIRNGNSHVGIKIIRRALQEQMGPYEAKKECPWTVHFSDMMTYSGKRRDFANFQSNLSFQ